MECGNDYINICNCIVNVKYCEWIYLYFAWIPKEENIYRNLYHSLRMINHTLNYIVLLKIALPKTMMSWLQTFPISFIVCASKRPILKHFKIVFYILCALASWDVLVSLNDAWNSSFAIFPFSSFLIELLCQRTQLCLHYEWVEFPREYHAYKRENHTWGERK